MPRTVPPGCALWGEKWSCRLEINFYFAGLWQRDYLDPLVWELPVKPWEGSDRRSVPHRRNRLRDGRHRSGPARPLADGQDHAGGQNPKDSRRDEGPVIRAREIVGGF